jgi:hypothetical protein
MTGRRLQHDGVDVPLDANPRLREVKGVCGCIGMGPGSGRVLKREVRVCSIDEPWKQKDRVQIGCGFSETQDRAKAGTTVSTAEMKKQVSGSDWPTLREQADPI